MDFDAITCLLRVLGGNHHDRILFNWWFGFSRSYEDEEGRIHHVLSEIEFEGSSVCRCTIEWNCVLFWKHRTN